MRVKDIVKKKNAEALNKITKDLNIKYKSFCLNFDKLLFRKENRGSA